MTRLIQIADDHVTDTDIVRLIGTGEDELIPLFTYLITDDEEFFLQISAPNRNLGRFAPNPFTTIALGQMVALLDEDRGYTKESLVSHIRFYEATILARMESRSPTTPYIRPSTGTVAKPAETSVIEAGLRLPKGTGGEDEPWRIGRLARSGEAEVSIVVDETILDHHILVAGATGSGKSHLLANLAHAADAMGRCIILFDHKPDHQNHHEKGSDPQFARAFCLNEGEGGTGTVRYWTLDPRDDNKKAGLLKIPARGLDPEILAGTIFYRAGEENQADTFAAIASAFFDRDEGETVYDLVDFVKHKSSGEIQKLFGDADVSLHGGTLGAIKRKLLRPESRIPSFVDPGGQRDFLGETAQTELRTADISSMFRPGLNVIRIGEGDARGYALFLSHLLRHATEVRTQEIQSKQSSETTPEMIVIVDEAADIFKADSRHLRNAATGMLAERIRKGRSLQIGYVIAVQDAGDVPENIRHNLNTTIVGRHRHLNTLREALPTVREGLLSSADRLDPGEMLVDLFGVPSLLLVKMDLSRSKLTVAPSRRSGRNGS